MLGERGCACLVLEEGQAYIEGCGLSTSSMNDRESQAKAWLNELGIGEHELTVIGERLEEIGIIANQIGDGQVSGTGLIVKNNATVTITNCDLLENVYSCYLGDNVTDEREAEIRRLNKIREERSRRAVDEKPCGIRCRDPLLDVFDGLGE